MFSPGLQSWVGPGSGKKPLNFVADLDPDVDTGIVKWVIWQHFVYLKVIEKNHTIYLITD